MTNTHVHTASAETGTYIGRSRGLFVSAVMLLLLVTVIFLFGQSFLYAAETQEQHTFEQAKRDLENRDFDKAYQGLYELFKHDPENPDINFLLGRAAFESRDYEAAVMAFERVLIARPDAIRVKLEMARSLYNLGSVETARQYFDEVLATDPPENVKKNIELYLNAISLSIKEHFLSGRISLGVDWDDNANIAPASSEVEISTALGDLIPVSVDRAARDQIRSSLFNLNYLYKPSESIASWNISILDYNAAYRYSENLDINLLDLKAGLSLKAKALSMDIYGTANQLSLDSKRYQRSYGAGTSISMALRPEILLKADARYRKKNFENTFERDSITTSLGFGPVLTFGPNRVTTSLGWEYENAKEDMNSYTRISTVASYDCRLPWGFIFLANHCYQGSNYKETNTLFNKKRRDDVQYYTLGMAKSLWQSGSSNTTVILNAGYTYTRARSNIELYTYTKNVNSCSVSFVF